MRYYSLCIAVQAMEVNPAGGWVMDAKALYDALLSEQQNQDDERAALECSLIKEDSETLGGRPRWAPHDKNPAGALTKVEGAHFAPMAKLLNTSRFCIKEESEELPERKKKRKKFSDTSRGRGQHQRNPMRPGRNDCQRLPGTEER